MVTRDCVALSQSHAACGGVDRAPRRFGRPAESARPCRSEGHRDRLKACFRAERRRSRTYPPTGYSGFAGLEDQPEHRNMPISRLFSIRCDRQCASQSCFLPSRPGRCAYQHLALIDVLPVATGSPFDPAPRMTPSLRVMMARAEQPCKSAFLAFASGPEPAVNPPLRGDGTRLVGVANSQSVRRVARVRVFPQSLRWLGARPASAGLCVSGTERAATSAPACGSHPSRQ